MTVQPAFAFRSCDPFSCTVPLIPSAPASPPSPSPHPDPRSEARYGSPTKSSIHLPNKTSVAKPSPPSPPRSSLVEVEKTKKIPARSRMRAAAPVETPSPATITITITTTMTKPPPRWVTGGSHGARTSALTSTRPIRCNRGARTLGPWTANIRAGNWISFRRPPARALASARWERDPERMAGWRNGRSRRKKPPRLGKASLLWNL